MNKLAFSLSTETKDGKSKTVFEIEKDGKKMTATFDPEKENEVDFVAKLLEGFGKEEKKQEPKVGNNVRIVDAGKRYRTLSQWATANLKGDQLIAFGNGQSRNIEKGMRGTIEKIAPKNVISDEKIAAVRVSAVDYSFIVLMDLDGLEVVS